ncbi:Linearmycin resistance permease protein LnrN [subsurface metagenome]
MRFLALASRNLKETYRDPLALGFLLAFPLVFMLLFGAILSGDTISTYPVGVIDDDNTPLSQAFINEALAEVPALEVFNYDDADTARKDLKFGDLKAYIVIPPGFGEQVSQNWQGEETNIILNITYDESDLMLSEQLISIINAVTRSFARIEIPITINANPIHIETEITFIDFMGPGIIVFGLLILIPTSARIMVRDKEKGFLSRLLTTPARPVDFISGYSLCLVAVAIVQIIIFILAGWLFGMDIVGSLWLAFLIFFLTGLSSIGIGMFVASLSKSENQAEPLCWLFAMPLAMLSGVWFSIEMLPPYLRAIAYAFPYAHTIDASRAVLIRGVGVEAISSDLLFLVGWAVVIFAIGVILFRRSMRS